MCDCPMWPYVYEREKDREREKERGSERKRERERERERERGPQSITSRHMLHHAVLVNEIVVVLKGVK